MNRNIKVALWGFGHMNKIILSMLLEKGYQVVTVIGNHNFGEDAGVVAEISSEKLGVSITPRE
jgi:glutamyl-tRNA reductase